MFDMFLDSPEYKQRKATPFRPPKATLAEIHASIPKHLYERSTFKGVCFVARDVFFSAVLYQIAIRMDPFVDYLLESNAFHVTAAKLVKLLLWASYWWWQGLVFAGLWCLGHEAGHSNLARQSWPNHVIGFCLHTFLLVPYYSWRSTHHAHHKATSSIERDENYVPRTRTDYSLPPAASAVSADYHEMFEETPVYTLVRMLVMQLAGWQYYLLANALGSPMYPTGTNHFSPSSPLFKPHERNGIILSNVGLSVMASIFWYYTATVGISSFLKLYFVPYLLVNHWIVMLTFLHHTDPTLPHYRRKEWSFLRGAVATVDRPILGWIGRVFFHNVSHDHIAHHLFSSIPFYNQPEVTEHIKRVLMEDYNYDSTNTFRAFYRSFTECCFIEDDGDIVFYKDKHGESGRRLQELKTGIATSR